MLTMQIKDCLSISIDRRVTYVYDVIQKELYFLQTNNR